MSSVRLYKQIEQFFAKIGLILAFFVLGWCSSTPIGVSSRARNEKNTKTKAANPTSALRPNSILYALCPRRGHSAIRIATCAFQRSVISPLSSDLSLIPCTFFSRAFVLYLKPCALHRLPSTFNLIPFTLSLNCLQLYFTALILMN